MKAKKFNTEIFGVIFGISLLFITSICFLLILIFQDFLADWEFPLLLITFLINLLALLLIILFTQRFLILQKMMNSGEYVVSWNYDENEYKRLTRLNYEKARLQNFLASLILGIFFLLISIPFLILIFLENNYEELYLFPLLMFSIWFFLSIIINLIPLIRFYFTNISDSRTYISQQGIYFLGELYTWSKPFGFLKGVTIKKNKLLQVKIMSFVSSGYFRYSEMVLELPIPEDKIEEIKSFILLIKS